MERKNVRLMHVVWALLIAAIVFSALTLFPGGIRLVSGRDYEIIKRYKRLEEVRSILSEEYYLEAGDETLVQGAVKGMAAALEDDYTNYYTPEEMEILNRDMSGEYTGVGLVLQLSETGMVEIVRVYENSPASAAGLQAGDIVIAVSEKEVSGIDMQQFEAIVMEMRGENGTEFTMEVERAGKRFSATLVRGEVAVSSIDACMLEGDIAYISIAQFGGDAVEGFRAACEQLRDARALVIDVRGNPGGRLDDVLAIADELLDGGMVVYMEDRSGTRQEYFAGEGAWDVPLVVLADGGSASASEILAAAVQDNGRGVVIGETTFGKGVVQSLVTFEADGAGLQYTMARYFTPSGRDIHQKGVGPDISVQNDDGFVRTDTPDTENDAQLACALEYLQRSLEKKENAE